MSNFLSDTTFGPHYIQTYIKYEYSICSIFSLFVHFDLFTDVSGSAQKVVEGIMIWVEWQATVMGNRADVWLYVLEAKMHYNSCSP